MKLHLFKFICGNCKCNFKSPKLCSSSYGEFLLRSESGEIVYLNAIEDPVYREVEFLLKQLPQLQGKSTVVLATLLRKVFSVACDSDGLGHSFSIDTNPVCPSCGSRNIPYWEATEPPEHIEYELLPATHIQWFSLSEPEKLNLLASELKMHTIP